MELSFLKELTVDQIIHFGGVIAITIFSLIIFFILVRTMLKLDMTQLFLTEPGANGYVSHTKFWGNIAYFVATVVFFVANVIHYDHFKENIEMLWLIYLSIVASNNVANKFIAYKFRSQAQNTPSKTEKPPEEGV